MTLGPSPLIELIKYNNMQFLVKSSMTMLPKIINWSGLNFSSGVDIFGDNKTSFMVEQVCSFVITTSFSKETDRSMGLLHLM